MNQELLVPPDSGPPGLPGSQRWLPGVPNACPRLPPHSFYNLACFSHEHSYGQISWQLTDPLMSLPGVKSKLSTPGPTAWPCLHPPPLPFPVPPSRCPVLRNLVSQMLTATVARGHLLLLPPLGLPCFPTLQAVMSRALRRPYLTALCH